MKIQDIEGLQESFDSFERMDVITDVILIGKEGSIRRIILND